MQEEDEDKPTVVLDFNAMKEELKSSEDLTDAGIEFNLDGILGDDAPLESSVEEDGPSYEFNIYLFDYNDDFFSKNFDLVGMTNGLGIINSLSELNKTLSDDPGCLVVFYYNQSPKAVNQLSAQIKAKFKKARTLIVANNLSPKKAQAHASSKYASNSYLSYPFKKDEFHKAISEISWE